MTVVGSADGTPPFFGRLRAAYSDPRAAVRGLVAGLGLALAYEADLAAYDGGARFLAMFAVGALCYGGVDLGFDACERRARRTRASCRAGASMRSGSGSAAWSRARSDGISTPPSSRW